MTYVTTRHLPRRLWHDAVIVETFQQFSDCLIDFQLVTGPVAILFPAHCHHKVYRTSKFEYREEFFQTTQDERACGRLARIDYKEFLMLCA